MEVDANAVGVRSIREEILTDEERQAEAEGRLDPDEAVAVGVLGRAVDEATAHPGGCAGTDGRERKRIVRLNLFILCTVMCRDNIANF